MNNNRSVLIMVAVVFVVVGIFLYFVFRSGRQDDLQQAQDGKSEFVSEVDEDFLAQINTNDKEEKTENATPIVSSKNTKDEVAAQAAEHIPAQTNLVTGTQKTPQTGPGETAAVISFFVATLVAVSVFVQANKKNDIA